ncbi:Uncharacterized protein DAT39_010228, partial [Clarias magur]
MVRENGEGSGSARAGQEKARPEQTTSDNTTAGKDTEEASTPPTENPSCTVIVKTGVNMSTPQQETRSEL